MKRIIFWLGIILLIAACSTQKGFVEVKNNTGKVLLKTVWNMNLKLLMQDLKPGIRCITVRQRIAHSNTTKTGTASMFRHGTIIP